MVLIFKPQNAVGNTQHLPALQRILSLDLIGNALVLGSAVMLFLALQEGETSAAWSSSLIIGLLVGSGVTFMIFISWQIYLGDEALIPPRIVKQQSVAASCLLAFFIYSALLIHVYYLPQWFQAVRGDDAILSGVHMIPYCLANALLSIIAGVIVSKTGYFTPPAIIGGAIATAGCGLIYTLNANTTTAQWIGYEILVSAGFGLAVQQGFTAVQSVLPMADVPIGTAAVVAMQSLGGAVFISVGNAILINHLTSEGANLQGVDIAAVIRAGASGLRDLVPVDMLPALLEVYNDALDKVFLVAIPLAGLSFLSSCLLEWRSVKQVPEEKSNV